MVRLNDIPCQENNRHTKGFFIKDPKGSCELNRDAKDRGIGLTRLFTGSCRKTTFGISGCKSLLKPVILGDLGPY